MSLAVTYRHQNETDWYWVTTNQFKIGWARFNVPLDTV